MYCVICREYRKFEKLQISYILEKTLILSVICSKCKNEDEKIFKEEESIEESLFDWKYIIPLKKWVNNLIKK